MRRPAFLASTVSVWHVLVLNAITLVLVGILVGGALGDGLVGRAAFKPAGAFRMATAASTTSQVVTGAMGETTILRVSFRVPSGRRADIAAFFNSQITKVDSTPANPPIGLCFNSIRLDNAASGPILNPGELLTLDGFVDPAADSLHAVTASVQGVRNDLPPGNHTLYVRANSGGEGCRWQDRSIVVLANLR
jgi:hypothetical protein